MKKREVVFVPAPGPGHLVSAVEFSKRLIEASECRISVSILLIHMPFSGSDPAARSENGIRYVSLPQVELPTEAIKESVEHGYSMYIASHVPHVRDAIVALQADNDVAALFVDMFCTSMIEVATELSLPSYLFFCSGAAFLGLLLQLPLDSALSRPEDDCLVHTFRNPVPARVLPDFVFTRLGHTALMDHSKRYAKTKGIIINTFAELELYALSSLLQDYHLTPAVYTVGPVLDLGAEVQAKCDRAERARIMGWLDKQPHSSVVFLCFGSGGYFNQQQTKEIAKGLIQSGHRFVWSVRKPPIGGQLKPIEYTERELRGILGDEFMGGERGLVCGWAPQLEILAHNGVGAFVSHCGWNSTLEALWFGKPIVAWPLCSEQHVNAFELVKELGIAVELILDYRLASTRVLEASHVERAVRCVMEEDNPVRVKAKEMAGVCRATLMEGGSSSSCVDQLISDLLGDLSIKE